MRQIFNLTVASILASLCFGCAVAVGNVEDNKNSVRLESDNFVVEKRVSASSSAIYVLGIPLAGLPSANDIATEMSKNAELYGKPKGLTNYAVDRKITSIPFLFLPVVTYVSLEVSADVIDFSKKGSVGAVAP